MPSSKGFRNKKGERSSEAVPMADIMRGLMLRREFRAGAGMAGLMSSWESIVGERLAAETAPAGLERGVLVVTASNGAWAAQVTFLAEEVCRRANEELGSEAVKQVRVRVRKPL